MKFQFKIQQFQEDAADAVVKVFSRQSKQGDIKYRFDIGKREQTLFD
jgi:type III restriction enzyme